MNCGGRRKLAAGRRRSRLLEVIFAGPAQGCPPCATGSSVLTLVAVGKGRDRDREGFLLAFKSENTQAGVQL